MSFVYRGLKATKQKHPVTEQELDYQLQQMLQHNPRVTEITDRPARSGDEVILDYSGYCDGVRFEGGTAENQSLVLGSGTFIPGFEEQLMGKNPEEKVIVSVTFPQQYHSADLAGKEAQFHCVIHKILEKTPYVLDDTFAREVGKCENLDELRQKLMRSMQAYADQQSEISLQDSLLQQASVTLDMEITDAQVEQAVNEQMQAMSAQLAQQGATLQMYCQFMNTTEEKLRQEAIPAARQSILTAAAIEQIVALEGLTAEQEEIDQACQHICRRNGITMEQLKAMYDAELEQIVRRSVLTGKVMELIRNAAEVTEE